MTITNTSLIKACTHHSLIAFTIFSLVSKKTVAIAPWTPLITHFYRHRAFPLLFQLLLLHSLLSNAVTAFFIHRRKVVTYCQPPSSTIFRHHSCCHCHICHPQPSQLSLVLSAPLSSPLSLLSSTVTVIIHCHCHCCHLRPLPIAQSSIASYTEVHCHYRG